MIYKIRTWFFRRWLRVLSRKKRISDLEDTLRVYRVNFNAMEAEMRMYRIRLGWEMPGIYSRQGQWVWHDNSGKLRPFPGDKFPQGCYPDGRWMDWRTK